MENDDDDEIVVISPPPASSSAPPIQPLNNNNDSHDVSEEVKRRYQPILMLHSEEIYFPVHVSDYIANTHWIVTSTAQHPEPFRIDYQFDPLTSAQLDEELQKRPMWNSCRTTLAIKQPEENPIIYGCGDHRLVNTVPLVVHVYDDMEHTIYIQYWAFYAWNGYSPVAKLWTAGTHQCDLEVVVAAIHRESHELIGYYLSQHGDMVFCRPEELEYEDGHPVVFVARYNHAHYTRARKIKRFGGFTYDLTDIGTLWFPHLFSVYDCDHPLYDANTMGFVRYRGDLGNGRVTSFSGQSIWRSHPRQK